jgi:hypothetical protein
MMTLTALTLGLLIPAYFVARYVANNARPKWALALVLLLAIVSAVLIPGGSRIPPWQFVSGNVVDLALYLGSAFTFFIMSGMAILLAQRMTATRA